jgi:hypothetical protein
MVKNSTGLTTPSILSSQFVVKKMPSFSLRLFDDYPKTITENQMTKNMATGGLESFSCAYKTVHAGN